MNSTKATHSLKKLFSGYHEPAALSSQQSRQLLDNLKLSFRDQLDREYGRSSSTSFGNRHRAAATTDAAPLTRERHRRPAADQHLKTLLSNPLFSYKTQDASAEAAYPSGASSSKSRLAREAHMPTLTPLSPLSNERDPMDVFDHAVSKGMMTINAATGCLVAKSKQLQTAATARDSTSTDTAIRVVRWLRWSHSDNALDFLDERNFMRALMPFIVSERIEQVVWHWIERTVTDTNPALQNGDRLRRASFLLNLMVQVKGEPQNGNLDAAITTLLQAEDLLHSNSFLSKLMVKPWRAVSWLSTVESQSRTAPSEKLFDAHVATADCLTTSVEIEQAHLQLYHPTHADHSLAVRFFEDKQKIRSILQGMTPEKLRNMLPTLGKVQWMAILGYDTVQYLTHSGRRGEAEHVIELLQSDIAPLFQKIQPT